MPADDANGVAAQRRGWDGCTSAARLAARGARQPSTPGAQPPPSSPLPPASTRLRRGDGAGQQLDEVPRLDDDVGVVRLARGAHLGARGAGRGAEGGGEGEANGQAGGRANTRHALSSSHAAERAPAERQRHPVSPWAGPSRRAGRTVMEPSTRLSSQPMPCSFSAFVTAGHTSRRYFSAGGVGGQQAVAAASSCGPGLEQRGQLRGAGAQAGAAAGVAGDHHIEASAGGARTSVLGEERGKGALLQQARGVVLLLERLDLPVVDALVVPRLVLLVLHSNGGGAGVGSERRRRRGCQRLGGRCRAELAWGRAPSSLSPAPPHLALLPGRELLALALRGALLRGLLLILGCHAARSNCRGSDCCRRRSGLLGNALCSTTLPGSSHNCATSVEASAYFMHARARWQRRCMRPRGVQQQHQCRCLRAWAPERC